MPPREGFRQPQAADGVAVSELPSRIDNNSNLSFVL
jgi:hypothetical protein